SSLNAASPTQIYTLSPHDALPILTIRSRQATVEAGHEVEVVGGLRRDAVPCGCPIGTTIEIRNLFYNTPVRRKFLRASQTEIGQDRKSTRLNSSHVSISYAVFCLK